MMGEKTITIPDMNFNFRKAFEQLIDFIAAILAGGFIWGLLSTPGLPMGQQWFALGLAIAAGFAAYKLMRSHVLFKPRDE